MQCCQLVLNLWRPKIAKFQCINFETTQMYFSLNYVLFRIVLYFQLNKIIKLHERMKYETFEPKKLFKYIENAFKATLDVHLFHDSCYTSQQWAKMYLTSGTYFTARFKFLFAILLALTAFVLYTGSLFMIESVLILTLFSVIKFKFD